MGGVSRLGAGSGRCSGAGGSRACVPGCDEESRSPHCTCTGRVSGCAELMSHNFFGMDRQMYSSKKRTKNQLKTALMPRGPTDQVPLVFVYIHHGPDFHRARLRLHIHLRVPNNGHATPCKHKHSHLSTHRNQHTHTHTRSNVSFACLVVLLHQYILCRHSATQGVRSIQRGRLQHLTLQLRSWRCHF